MPVPTLAALLSVCFLVFIVALATYVALKMFGMRVSLEKRSYATIEQFIDQFGSEVGLPGRKLHDAFFAKLSQASFSGPVGGRAARLSFETEDADGRDLEVPVAKFAVACESVPQLTVSVKGLLGTLSRALGLAPTALTSGDRAFDDRYALETLEPGRAKVELAKPAFREAIESVFAHYKLSQLELARGEIVAHVPVKDLSPDHYRRLLERLATLARTIDEIVVKVAPGELTNARCGYCHETIAADAEDILACETCSTVTHKACRAELGRCPVAGCEGKPAQKTRVRG